MDEVQYEATGNEGWVVQHDEFYVWKFIIGLGVAGAAAGVAALLRSKEDITRRAILSAILNSGLFAAAVGLLMWGYYQGEHPELIAGVSLMAGLGGDAIIRSTLKGAKSALPKILRIFADTPNNPREDDP